MNKVKLLSSLLTKHYKNQFNSDIAKEILGKFEVAEDIYNEINRLNKEVKVKEEEWKKTLKEYNHNIEIIQKSCTHDLTQYYPDASGNNDSFTECEICGCEV